MPIARTLFTEDHEAFRDSYRRFLEREVVPQHAAWEAQGYVDREVWRKAGENGFLCTSMPEEFGGADADKLFQVILMEEGARAGSPAGSRSRRRSATGPCRRLRRRCARPPPPGRRASRW